MLNPELREWLWPFLTGIAKQNGIMPRCIGGVADHVHLLLSLPSLGTDNEFDRPSGRGLSASLPRHFVPGYYHP
jgi:hypothetical protein